MESEHVIFKVRPSVKKWALINRNAQRGKYESSNALLRFDRVCSTLHTLNYLNIDKQEPLSNPLANARLLQITAQHCINQASLNHRQSVSHADFSQ